MQKAKKIEGLEVSSYPRGLYKIVLELRFRSVLVCVMLMLLVGI